MDNTGISDCRLHQFQFREEASDVHQRAFSISTQDEISDGAVIGSAVVSYLVLCEKFTMST
jgi:hypothetical protein